ncbi:MAG TPA: hypothetical protein VHO28_15395 [Ignavibacteriales bacterium]|nr:hypothetical protein [Ignavibacteriales bacterium]
MKKLVMFALYIGIIGLAAGCGGDDDKNPAGPLPGGNITGMSGKAENWNLGTGKKVYFSMPVSSTQDVVFGSSDIAEDGSFSIQIQEPTAEYMMPLASYVDENNCQSGVVISDSSARCSYAQLNVAEGNSFIGYIDRTNSYYESDSVGAFYAMFIYADKNVTISGVDTCMWDNGITGVGAYNVVLAKGWNQVAVTTTFFNSEEYHVTYSAGEPAGAKYIYFNYGSGLSKMSGIKRPAFLKR